MYPDFFPAYAQAALRSANGHCLADEEDLMQSAYVRLLKYPSDDDKESAYKARVYYAMVSEMRSCGPVFCRPKGTLTKTFHSPLKGEQSEGGEFGSVDPWKKILEKDDWKSLKRFIRILFARMPNESLKKTMVLFMKGKTYREVGEILKVSEARISQYWSWYIRPIAKQCLSEDPMLLDGMVRRSDMTHFKSGPPSKAGRVLTREQRERYYPRRNEQRRLKRKNLKCAI